ncbi:phosphatase PAP2 family protein [Streptomyces sp. NPDC056683]|uniref:phosphatase PAP2 family protein n=1 Tax=Streptomyces sp. NPDC056683 TaxID=3345910 RepID=UPI0036A3DA30
MLFRPRCARPGPDTMVVIERVQSGAHHPTDVAAGAPIGLAAAWFVRRSPRPALRWRLS